MSYTPFNAPLLSGLLGDMEIARQFSIDADFKAMLTFEAALAKTQANQDMIPKAAAEAIANACEIFEPDVKAINQAVPRDGLAVPEFIRQLRSAVGEEYGTHVHFGSTSQDVIDTSLVLRLVDVISILETRLETIDTALGKLSEQFGENELMGRTRMQAALPIQVADRIRTWHAPLQDHIARIEVLKPQLLKLQLGGPVGTNEAFGDKADALIETMSEALGLESPAHCWHTDRSTIVKFCNWLSLVTGTLGKMGMDISLMAQQGIDEIKLSGGGGSSAMPHKQNPIKSEALVTLARFNASQVAGMHHTLLHEQERSGSAWTLEWMLVPQMCVATGAAMQNAVELISSIEQI